jgi:uncharacterized cupredoxin-like copper-binding protein
MLRARLTAIALFAAVPLALAACGGDDDEEASTTPATTTAAPAAATVDVSLTDFALDPSDPTVKAGEVTFNVTNDGQTLHNIEVEAPGGEVELPEDLQPGQSGTLKVELNKPGKFEWYCPVGNHREMGMEGEITVQ